MLKGGSAKAGLPKPGLQERAKQASTPYSSTTTTSAGIKTSRSSNTLASDLRLSRLKRASSDDALAKPTLGAAASGSRMRKTVTTGAIADLAEAKPRSLTAGVQAAKKSGIPAPREIPPAISRDRVSLRDQLRTSTAKKMVPSSSTSSLATLAKQRGPVKTRADVEGTDNKGLLENQVKDLLAEAKAKDLEISKLRMELQRCRGKAASSSSSSSSSPPASTPSPQEGAPEPAQSSEALVLVGELREKNGKYQRELAALREENQALKGKLLSLEASPLSAAAKPTAVNGLPSDADTTPGQTRPFPGGSPLKTSVSSGSDITKGSPSPDSEFEKIPSRSESVSSGGGGSGGVKGMLGRRDPSVESLTERIQKMEESHHSTSEELQATLQELADQQQVVQELTAENERLAEQKGLLQTSLQQQRERLELLAQKNEALAARLQEQAQAQREAEGGGGQGPRVAELEQRYQELVESSRFEREKLVDIQQQLTGGLRALEQEHQEAQGQGRALREERDGLRARLDGELALGGRTTRALEELRASAEGLRAENGRLRAQVDVERQKVCELKAVQSAGDSTELQGLLKAAHAERDRLGAEVAELRQELLRAQADAEHVRAALSKAEGECQEAQQRGEEREQELRDRVSSLEEGGQQAEAQIKDLKETIFELEDQVEQQRAVHLHTNHQTILDLENQVKRVEEQKTEVERQMKALSKQRRDETEEWQRFQADLQTAVVVANNFKVEAQQEQRSLRRVLQEEQERNAKLSSDLEQLQGVSRLGAGASFDTKTAVEGR